jgi:hypothetical protein
MPAYSGSSAPWREKFVDGWTKCRWPKGTGPLADLFVRSQGDPRPPQLENPKPRLESLAKFCRSLQQVAGDRAFFLGCRTAAMLTGCTKSTANRDLNRLVSAGLLKIVRKGTRKTGLANELKWMSD